MTDPSGTTDLTNEAATRRLAKALRLVRRTAFGDSNDAELEALQDALDLALHRWPDIDRPAINAEVEAQEEF